MPRSENLTLQDFGALGASQAIGTDAAIIQNPGPGKFKIWGHCRHTQADGMRLVVGAATIVEISQEAARVAQFGPVVVDILNATDDIIVELEKATGVGEAASATVYAQKIT